MGSLMEKAIAAIVRQAFERPPPRKPVDDKAAADALVAESKRAAERVERYGSSAYLDAPEHRQPVASINKRFLLNTIRDADSHNKDVAQQRRRGRSARDRSPARLGADSASRRRRDDSDSFDSASDDEDEDFMKRLNRMPKRGRGAVGARVDAEDQVDSAASAAVESEGSLGKSEQMRKDKKKKSEKKKKKSKKNKDK